MFDPLVVEFKGGKPAAYNLSRYVAFKYLSKRVGTFSKQFFVDLRSSQCWHMGATGQFESGVLVLMKSLATATNSTKLLIDIGASIGNHSIILSDTFESVKAFEPHPVSRHILHANILRNGVKNVEVFPFGLGADDCQVTMEHNQDFGLSRVKERSKLSASHMGFADSSFTVNYPAEIRVASRELRQFGADLKNSFLKIDVEGMEAEILKCLLPVIQESRPVICFEWFTNAQPELAEIIGSLEKYSLFGLSSSTDHGNSIKRGFKELARGRQWVFSRIPKTPRPYYALAALVPNEKVLAEFDLFTRK
jgi:FkbM family methyltransferase